MNRSEHINEIGKALAKAQAEMEPASKSSVNPHFKSKYAALPEVAEVAKALNRNGIAYVQPTTSGEGFVQVETVLIHGESGQWISGELTLTPQQNTPQGVGSAITYARRFSLCSLAGIVADEDDDGNAASARPPFRGKVDDSGVKVETPSQADVNLTASLSASVAANGDATARAAKFLDELQIGFDTAADWQAWITKHNAEIQALPGKLKMQVLKAHSIRGPKAA